jgi:type II secretory pathway component PulM
MEQIAAWWGARTARERKLMQGAALFVLMILTPAWAFLSAMQFRDEGAARLAAARAVQADVARLAESAVAAPGEGGTLRERVLALAQANGVAPHALEAADEARVRVAFAPADSLMIYRWVDAVGRTGAVVSRSAIVRVDESDLVTAEFEVVASP